MGEIRAVDDDQDIRLRRNDIVGGLADTAQDRRQPLCEAAEPDDGQVIDGKQAMDARRRHGAPADAGKLQPVARCAD